jgi:hypothetical protein
MKKFILLSIAMVSLFYVSENANAGFLIDPYFGIGSSKSTLDLSGVDDETASSTVAGARLGYSFILISAGIDYQMLSGKDALDEDMKVTSTSAFVGVDLPILLRFWGEYFFSSNIDGDTFDTNDTSFKDGYGIGIGFTGLPFVSINLEVETLNYDMTISGLDYDYSTASTILSVSLPLDF